MPLGYLGKSQRPRTTSLHFPNLESITLVSEKRPTHFLRTNTSQKRPKYLWRVTSHSPKNFYLRYRVRTSSGSFIVIHDCSTLVESRPRTPSSSGLTNLSCSTLSLEHYIFQSARLLMQTCNKSGGAAEIVIHSSIYASRDTSLLRLKFKGTTSMVFKSPSIPLFRSGLVQIN